MERNTYRITGDVDTLRSIKRAVSLDDGIAACKVNGTRAVVTCYGYDDRADLEGPASVQWQRIQLRAGAVPTVHSTSGDTFKIACEDWL